MRIVCGRVWDIFFFIYFRRLCVYLVVEFCIGRFVFILISLWPNAQHKRAHPIETSCNLIVSPVFMQSIRCLLLPHFSEIHSFCAGNRQHTAALSHAITCSVVIVSYFCFIQHPSPCAVRIRSSAFGIPVYIYTDSSVSVLSAISGVCYVFHVKLRRVLNSSHHGMSGAGSGKPAPNMNDRFQKINGKLAFVSMPFVPK